jgi:hypothetical protein
MPGNQAVLHLIGKLGLRTEKRWEDGVFFVNIFLT